MDRIACIFFEGGDSKVALFGREGGTLTLLKAESIDTSLAFAEQGIAAASVGGLQTTFNYNVVAEEASTFNKTVLQKLNEFFRGEDLSKCRFIPILTEPAIAFQKLHDKKELSSSQVNGKGKITTVVDFVDVYENATLAVYPSGKSSYLQVLHSLARMNNRRVLRIPAVKSAEISLASYIARHRTFSKEETSLILYIGKEYSKLLFLRGDKLFHIGSTLSVGKNSFDAHNVIVRKILLELEYASLGNITNIIVCGEDNSDDLISSIKEAYPRSNVSVQHVESVEVREDVNERDSFVVPAAVVDEYIAELDKKLTGINLLPQYVRDEQKIIQLGWQGYAILTVIVLSTALFSMHIASNAALIQSKKSEISRIQAVLDQNREAVSKINSFEARIRNVDRTKAVLNQLSAGTGIVSAQLKKLSTFTENKGNVWIGQLMMDQSKRVTLAGYTFSRIAAKELSDSYENALLRNMIFDPFRNSRAFKFSIEQGGVTDEKKK